MNNQHQPQSAGSGDFVSSGYGSRQISHLGYTLLGNGLSVCIMFPYVPGAHKAWLEGSDVHIAIPGGEIALLEIGQSALQAAARNQLLLVGIDALSRPVYERKVNGAAQT